jgi:hypothetical protein
VKTERLETSSDGVFLMIVAFYVLESSLFGRDG